MDYLQQYETENIPGRKKLKHYKTICPPKKAGSKGCRDLQFLSAKSDFGLKQVSFITGPIN